VIDLGTAQSATGTTVVLRAAAAFPNNTLIGATILVYGSTQGYWQRRIITANTLSDDTVTVDAFDVTPSGTITYRIIGTPPSPASGTLPGVNVVQISGDATAADNAEAFFDGTGYEGTNNVIPTVTTLTNLPAITANWLTAAGTAADFGTEVGTAVWASATRTLTSLSGLTVDTVTTLINLPAITANWLTAAGTAADFGTEVGTAVWASGTRTLTAGTNIDGSTFTAIPWNAAWDVEVESEATDALNAYDPPTRTEATADKDAILTQLPAAPVKNAAFTYVIKMVDTSGDPVTGLTVGFTRSIDGAAFGSGTGTVTEISTGHYKVAASAADMNGDVVAHRFTGTGAKDLTVVFKTVS
jgi:hypothetical protein